MKNHIINTTNNYGYISVLLHWLVALLVLGLFGLGWWMVELTYYDPWYNSAPWLHKSIGILLLFINIIRAILRWIQITPRPLSSYHPLVIHASYIVHNLLYFLLFFIMITGYLMSTADGRGIDVFGLFTLNTVVPLHPDQVKLVDIAHQYSAYTMIFFVLLHSLAALKHHFIDQDSTLTRMLGYHIKE